MTPIQGMVKANRIFTLQGHPEFGSVVLRALINRREKHQVFTHEQAEAMRSTLEKTVDDGYILDKALRYLGFI